jgi:hypothetical protein
MRTFVQQRPKAAQHLKPAKTTKASPTPSGQRRDSQSMLQLQRMIGNQAAQRLLRTSSESPDIESSTTASAGFAHDFSRVPTHSIKPLRIQPKLAVNAPGDIYEKEADRVAEQVLHMSEPQLRRNACLSDIGCPKCRVVQPSREPEVFQTKRVQTGEKGQTQAPSIVHEALTGSAQLLDSSVRGFMEPRFGHDFSQVRIHTDAKAVKSSCALNALAYTVGRHIVFNAGQYQPHTMVGRHLLAHELGHTIQQKAIGPIVQRAMKFEFQTRNVVWKTGGKKREKLPRKFGPTKKPKHSRFLHKGSKGKPAKGAKEGTAIELQSEARGFVEFETPSWHRKWCAIKKRIQEAVSMVDKIDTSKVVSTHGGVKTVEFPFDVKHLKKTKDFKKGLTARESLEVEILDPTWTAKIQASESFELPQFESFLTEHLPAEAPTITGNAANIVQDANNKLKKKIPIKSLVNLNNFVQIIIEHISQARHWNKPGGSHLAKEYISLLSRTNFTSIYRTLLSNDERTLFRAIVKSGAIPNELRLKAKDRIFPHGFVGRRYQTLTIQEWLTSITAKKRKRDKLSSIGGDNRALGRFPVDTRKGKKHSNLVKFEVRSTAGHNQSRPASEWVAFAEEVFKAAATNRPRTDSTELIYDPKKCP